MRIENPQFLGLPEPQEYCSNLLLEEYALTGELSVSDIRQRVAAALADSEDQRAKFVRAMEAGCTPGEQICRAAGTGMATTMIDGFVQPVGDSITGPDENGVIGITAALAQAAETMRHGGGVGYDFSRIRPRAAIVRGTDSRASGPVKCMRLFDAMCQTVESVGSRFAPQTGVLRVDHPDIEQFVDAKNTPCFESMGLDEAASEALMAMINSDSRRGSFARYACGSLSQFNLWVAVTDEFMHAVINDSTLDLVHEVPPADVVGAVPKVGDDGRLRYVYRTIPARDLWRRITANAFNGAGPGLIFIGHANRDNNLRYVETFEAVNPCGAQLLPPHGCSSLGSIMLQRFVRDPFTDCARFDDEAFGSAVHGMVELLDTVLDKTLWPLPEQGVEARNKRRIGLGYLGLGDAMAMMGVRYGTPDSVAFTRHIGTIMRNEAYRASVTLSVERGPFPLFEADLFLQEGTFASRLPDDLKADIRRHGIRNSQLLSLARTDTISMALGDNASSGIEPTFALRQHRTNVMSDGSHKTFVLENGAYRLFKLLRGTDAKQPDAFVTALDVSIEDQLAVLEAAVPMIDSATCKTVSVPPDYPFEDFPSIFVRAWKAGLKGITTDRPAKMQGVVVEDDVT